MLKAIRIATSICRAFATEETLVANPAKLQGNIIYNTLPAWLHKDVRAGSKSVRPDLNESDLYELAKVALTNSERASLQDNILRFCNECIARLGVENFKNFIHYHEFQIPTFTYLKNYSVYLNTCYKIFNYDSFLLKILVMCDLKKINRDSISRVMNLENLEGDSKKENPNLHIFKMLPAAKPIFDDYLNNAVVLRNEEYDGEDEDANVKEMDRVSGKKFIMDSILTFTQKSSSDHQKTNWIYFQIESGRDSMLTEEKVLKTLKSLKITSVRNLMIFNANHSHVPRIQLLNTKITPDDIKKSLSEELDLQRLNTLAKSNRSEPQKKPADQDEQLSGDFSTNSSEIEKDAKKFEDMITFCSKINTKNRSYGFVELEDSDSKAQILKSHFRLFGVEYERAFLVLDDADRKKTIQLNNMPWNLSPRQFCDWLDMICNNEGESMTFDYEQGLDNFLSDASYFYVEANSFPEAMKMVQIINAADFNERKVYANFKRGCGRFVEGKFFENFISPYNGLKQKQHIERRTRMKEALIKKISENVYISFDDGKPIR